jgi:hypothetical protein
MLFAIAWDTHTKEITYLFTSDHRFLTDSELGVGGHTRLVDEDGKAFDLAQYMNWLVTPQWADTVQSLSGDATWYAALRRDATSPEYGTIGGFVQSRYLKKGQRLGAAELLRPSLSEPSRERSRPARITYAMGMTMNLEECQFSTIT